jgi:hypothetical protein
VAVLCALFCFGLIASPALVAVLAMGTETQIDPRVEIRDRRDLPFFQVHVRALTQIRSVVVGQRRPRAIGFYALLCQLANEQRHWGGKAKLRASYSVLTERAGIGRSTVKQMLDLLAGAGVVAVQRSVGAGGGGHGLMVHLAVRDDPWLDPTVASSTCLFDAGRRLFLRNLGMLVLYLELCNEQRAEFGGDRARLVRVDLAARAGITVESLDDCNRALEAPGVLIVERSRGASGGRYLPSLYTVLEPGQGTAQRRLPQGENPGLAWRKVGTAKAEGEDSAARLSALSGPERSRSNARTGTPLAKENGNKPPSPPDGGSSADSVVVEETYVTERGRRRQRLVSVDLAAVRAELAAPGSTDCTAWEQVRTLLLEAVGESQFEIWLAPLQLIAVDRAGTLVVAAPEATLGWIWSRFGRLLGAASEGVGRPLRLAGEVERAATQLRDGAQHLGDGAPTVRHRNGQIAADRSLPGRMIGAMADTPAYTQVHNQSREVSG